MKPRQIIYKTKIIASIFFSQLIFYSTQLHAENEYINLLLKNGTNLPLVALNSISGDPLQDSTSLKLVKIDISKAEEMIQSAIPTLHDWNFDRKLTKDELDFVYQQRKHKK